MMADNKERPENESDQNESNQNENDWDASWSQFSKKRTGGVFELPPDEAPNPTLGASDERVEKLTWAWSNENGFLIGIAVILLIALFYFYVYETGGISH